MGAGRTNATPNLDSGNFFLGDSNNQAVTTSFTTAVSAAETSHTNVLVDGDFASEGLMKRDATSGSYSIVTDNSGDWNTAHGWGNHADAGYLTSFTEANDLSTSVTWADVPDANITENSVTQHQTALSITESQISDFGTYLTTHQDISGKADLTGATFTGDVNLGDNNKINIGASSDLQIYHDGSDSYIDDQGAGDLILKGLSHITMQRADTGVNLFRARPNRVQVYADGNIITTTDGDGLSVTGELSTTDTITAPNLDISTQGSVTTNIATGTAIQGSGTKILNLGTGFAAFADLTTVNIGTQYASGQNLINVGSGVNVSGNEDTINLKGNVNVDGAITAPNLDISTTGSVTTNIATGTGGSSDTKTVNLATGYSTGGTTTVNIAPTSSTTTKQINLNGDVSIAGTVTGGSSGVVLEHDKSHDLEPVLELQNTTASGSGYRGAFISMTGYSTSGTKYTRGVIGMGNSTAQYSFPYMAANITSVSCGIKLSGSSSSSYNALTPCNVIGTSLHNGMQCGHPFYKWNTVYATNGNISTSDQTHKRDVEELSEAETRVAVACKGLLRKYRWKDAYEEKGEEARIHFGIMAQDLRDAFSNEGLDASRYAMFCSDTWWEDETGERHEEQELAPEGAVETTQLGVRYEELLAFIIAAI